MKKIDDSHHDVLVYYFLNDQPMTCGMCGSRTSFDEGKNGEQLHRYLNAECGYCFFAVGDTE